jgi:transcriptional regulator with XRE-family HTH domain
MDAINTARVSSGQPPIYTATVIQRSGIMAHYRNMIYSKAIKRIRKSRGITQNKLAEMLGVEQPTVQRWESGARTPGADDMVNLAKALGISPSEFFMDEVQVPVGPKLFVKGAVASGVWVATAQWPEPEWLTFTGAGGVEAELEMRFGLRIEDEGSFWPRGTIIECVAHYGNARIPNGKKVIVTREREDGKFEVSVREMVIGPDNVRWLIAKSSNPAHQTPINYDHDDEAGIVETVISAVVVASTTLE